MTLSGYSSPEALAFDASGDLFIASGSDLTELAPPSYATVLRRFDAGATPNGLRFDAQGNLWVAAFAGGFNNYGTVSRIHGRIATERLACAGYYDRG